MTGLTTFDFEGAAVRTVADDSGEIWFHGNDVCQCLEYSNSRKALSDHVDPEDVTKRDTLSAGGNQQANFINEGGLYSLIFGSKKSAAKRFRKWVTHEVLPSLRRSGKYEIDPATDVDASVDEVRTYIALVREARLLFGRRAAQDLWRQTPLPKPVIPASSESVDSVADFVQLCTETADGERIAAMDLYKRYKEWCAETGRRPVTVTMFGRKAGLLLQRVKGHAHNYYEGIILL